MEDAYGILSISKGYLPTIWWKIKSSSEFEGRLGDSLQKGIGNDMVMLGSIGGFQYFERK